MKQTIKPEIFQALHKAVNELALRCDGASKQDGMGFNGADAQFGRQMAMTPFRNWSDKQAVAVYGMLAKYQMQLLMYGISYADIEKPEVNIVRRVEWNGKKFILKFEKDDPDFYVMLQESRELPGRYFNWETKANEVAASDELKTFAKKWKFTGNAETHKQLKSDVPIKTSSNVIELAENGKLVFVFDFDWDTLASIKAVPGRAWEDCPGYSGKVNTVVISEQSVKVTRAIADKWGFVFTKEAEQAISETLDKQRENLEASRALDSDIKEIEGLGGELRPFQKAGAAYLIKNKKTFLADEMGTGKTIQSLAAIKAVKSTCSIIIVPASLKLNWAREAKKWLGIKAVVLNGRKGQIKGRPEMIVANYDIYHHYLDQLRALEPDAVIFDESHRLKNHRSLRGRAADDLINGHLKDEKGKKRLPGQRQIPYVWFLTGTPVLNRPNELLHPLSIMGALDKFGGFWEFARRYIGARQGSFGLDMSGAQNLPELNQKLRAYGLFIRRTKEQVLPELPDKQWATIPVTLSNEKEYRKAEKDVIAFIGDRAVQETEFIQSVQDLPDDEKQKAIAKYRSSKEAAAARARQLTEINALKQLAAKGKLKEAINWIDDFLASGEKLIVFAYHRFVTEHLAKHYNCPFIIGGMPSHKRQEAVDSFQNDPNVKLIICNIVAAGEGLTLTAASNELFLEFAWTPAAMDQASDRAHRIGQKDNVVCWQMIGEGSIDEKVVQLIETKRAVVNAVTEGDDPESQGSIYGELVDYLMERK